MFGKSTDLRKTFSTIVLGGFLAFAARYVICSAVGNPSELGLCRDLVTLQAGDPQEQEVDPDPIVADPADESGDGTGREPAPASDPDPEG